jgi:hypothetical protein
VGSLICEQLINCDLTMALTIFYSFLLLCEGNVKSSYNN